MADAIIFEKKGKADTNFETLLWVLKAKGDGDLRIYLQMLLVDVDNTFVCTDGHRLHLAQIPEYSIEPGTYEYIPTRKGCAVILRKVSDIDFPEYRKVIPNGDTPVLGEIFNSRKYTTPGEALIKLFELTGKGVDLNYLLDILSTDSLVYQVKNDKSKPVSAIVFEREDPKRIALLMPTKRS